MSESGIAASRTFKQSTLRQNIWLALREAILHGELPPGSQINQAILAGQFGTSRGPIREALSLLEEEGLIVNVPYRGTFVAEFSLRTIEETYSLRLILERFAAERAIQYATDTQIAELRRIYNAMADAVRAQDMSLLHELDLAFHRHLYAVAQHELLLEQWSAIEVNVKRGILLGQVGFQLYTAQELLNEHAHILDAVEARDVATATQAVEHHIAEGGARLLARIRARDSECE